ncbi:UNVERIFIED_CONTAM: ATP-dependent RNA helicase DHX37 [Trichonephila clavipes]
MSDEEEVKVVQEGIKKIGTGKSVRLGDVMVLLRAVALFEDSKNVVKFCIKNGIRFKAMAEIHKMSIQLLRENKTSVICNSYFNLINDNLGHIARCGVFLIDEDIVPPKFK